MSKHEQKDSFGREYDLLDLPSFTPLEDCSRRYHQLVKKIGPDDGEEMPRRSRAQKMEGAFSCPDRVIDQLTPGTFQLSANPVLVSFNRI